MGLFDFLKGKKSDQPEIRDLVWMTVEAKWKGVAKLLEEDPNQRLLAWSMQTVDAWSDFSQSYPGNLPKAEHMGRVIPGRLQGENLLLLEHHIYLSEENSFLNDTQASRIWVASSLEDVIMLPFGSDRLMGLMQQMGANADEVIAHKMVSASIRRAQEKMDQKRGKVALDPELEEWMKGV